MNGAVPARALITTADDFGLSPAVNEAVEQAHRAGGLTSASLMVAAPAAADAVARARRLPDLAVGLHLVAVEGPAVLPPGAFPAAQLLLSLQYAFSAAARRRLAAEIRAQFEAFRRTGLPLDHANAHKHMHLHPVVGRLMLAIGRDYGLRAVRVPAEPGSALGPWCGVLRRAVARAGMIANDRVFGVSRSGRMTAAYVDRVVADLPPGITEIYFHPATETDATLRRTMPDYRHADELAALLRLRPPADVVLTSYGRLGAGPVRT